MTISIERVYDCEKSGDQTYFLVDRLWPRGISKEDMEGTEWCKEVAPSDSLRKWFGHDPEKWEEFKKRYFRELDENGDSLQKILDAAEKGPVVLLYGARDTEHNQAVALKEYLEKKID